MIPESASRRVTAEFPNDCFEILKKLRDLPTFAMSLGAKELFHTNFLAFLLESDDEDLKSVRGELCNLFFGYPYLGKVRTWREQSDLDLVILPAPRADIGSLSSKHVPLSALCHIDEGADMEKDLVVVIEAKLKSIPTERQLIDYSQLLKKGCSLPLEEVDIDEVKVNDLPYRWTHIKVKMGDDPKCSRIGAFGKNVGDPSRNNKTFVTASGGLRRVLLIPGTEPPFSEKWAYITWSCVLDCINAGLSKANSDKALVKIVRDYADSLEHILALLENVDAFVKRAIDPTSEISYGDFYRKVTDKMFQERRVGDLIGKFAMAILKEHFVNKLKNSLPSASGPWQGFANCNFQLESYVHYSNQQPGFGLEWLSTFRPSKKDSGERKERRLSFGVQIQGLDYRHNIAASGNRKPDLDVCSEMLGSRDDMSSWWLQSNGLTLSFKPSDTSKSKVGKPASIAHERMFYRFGKNDFVYTKASLDQTPVSQIGDLLLSSMKRAYESAQRHSTELNDCRVQLRNFLTGK